MAIILPNDHTKSKTKICITLKIVFSFTDSIYLAIILNKYCPSSVTDTYYQQAFYWNNRIILECLQIRSHIK